MKAQRKVRYRIFNKILFNFHKICGAIKSGVRVYEHSKRILVTACTTHPGDSKYCNLQKSEQHPAVLSSKLAKENREQLQSRKEKEKSYKEHNFTDNVYIMEEIKSSKVENGSEFF